MILDDIREEISKIVRSREFQIISLFLVLGAVISVWWSRCTALYSIWKDPDKEFLEKLRETLSLFI